MHAIKESDLPNYTYTDYVLWEGKWELINGIPYSMAPSPSPDHQSINLNIAFELKLLLSNCEKCKVFLPIDYKVSEETVLQPDVCVICGPYGDRPFVTVTPSIVFEVLSPSTKKKDLNLKYSIYEQQGVKYYVIVDPFKDIASVYKFVEGKYELALATGSETLEFETGLCNFVFDFSKIW